MKFKFNVIIANPKIRITIRDSQLLEWFENHKYNSLFNNISSSAKWFSREQIQDANYVNWCPLPKWYRYLQSDDYVKKFVNREIKYNANDDRYFTGL